MTGGELVFFVLSDVSGLGRGRSFPVSHLDHRMKAGVGCMPADQALTPFGAGLLRRLPALCAFTAPSVVSYLRLTAHSGRAGHTSLGQRNREVAIRLAGVSKLSGRDPAGQFNLEYRPADAAACGHMDAAPDEACQRYLRVL